MYGRDDAGGVSGMYAGKLDMLHNRWNECVGSVADRVCFALEGVVQEPVDQDRTVRRYANGSLHVSFHAFVIIDHFHAAAAKNVRWADHNRIADLSGNSQCFFNGGCHTRFRHRNL